MRIAIVAPGAVGGYFGVLLARSGENVGALARGAHLHAIAEHGLIAEVRSLQFPSWPRSLLLCFSQFQPGVNIASRLSRRAMLRRLPCFDESLLLVFSSPSWFSQI